MPSLTITTKGAASSDVQVEITRPPSDEVDEGAFTLRVKMGTVEEVFENVVES